MSADSAGGITVWNLTTGKAIGHNADARRRKSFGTVIASRPGSHTVAVGTNRGEILDLRALAARLDSRHVVFA